MKKTIVPLLLFTLSLFVEKSYPQNIVRGPYLQIATSNSIIVRWRTDSSSRSVVYFREANSSYRKATDTSSTTEHQIQLNGLKASTKYYYSAGKDSTQLSDESYFYTLPVAGQTALYRIGVFGDCGNNSVNQRNVRDQFLKYLDTNYLNSWLLLGDNAYWSGTESEYQSSFFSIYKNDLLKTSPVWPSPGNHDYANSLNIQISHNMPYYQVYNFPVNGEAGGTPSHSSSYYSFDIGNIHFLSLDSYGMETDNNYRLYDTTSPQVQWVKKDLEANQNKGWIIAYWHHPPYTMGSHNSDAESELSKIRQNFIRILERYGVDLVLCGHSHVYERSSFINGYLGTSQQFDENKYAISNSSGKYDGSSNSCPYMKDSATSPGTVYVVTGSSGQLGGQSRGYPLSVMQYSNNSDGGCLMLEVESNRLDAKWICGDGNIRDQFTIMKNVGKRYSYNILSSSTLTLAASYIGNYNWNGFPQQSAYVNKSFTEPGSYQYTVHDEYQCVSDTFDVQVIRSDWEKEIIIVPNPAKAVDVTIKTADTASVPASITVYDSKGAMIAYKKMVLNATSQHILSGKTAPGFYVLLVEVNGKIIYRKKLILE